jgi:hypothetical protein
MYSPDVRFKFTQADPHERRRALERLSDLIHSQASAARRSGGPLSLAEWTISMAEIPGIACEVVGLPTGPSEAAAAPSREHSDHARSMNLASAMARALR